VAVVFCVPASAGAQTAAVGKDSRIGELERWVAAVDAHVPGETDALITKAATLTPNQRALLLELAAPFAIYLRDRQPFSRKVNESEATAITAMAQRITASRTFPQWLHRAVMFETDVAILAPEMTSEAMRGARVPGMTEAINAQDGALGSRNLLNWHWSLARDLVGARDPAASNGFAASWYHAVALYQLDQMLLGELQPHLSRGIQMFPDDARLQFDRGCLADAYGSARVQAVMLSAQQGNFRPNVPPPDAARAQAAQQFERVLELDPGFLEARVRLARLRQQDGRNADALALLASAFASSMARQLEYVAHLIAGRANAGLGQVEEGAAHFRAALGLFPAAQTPVIGLSHLQLQNGDLEQAAALAVRLAPDANAEERNDPWWSYFQATWLEQGALVDRLRDEVRR
jgi:tetratricopeptide (TPR) repeat protein